MRFPTIAILLSNAFAASGTTISTTSSTLTTKGMWDATLSPTTSTTSKKTTSTTSSTLTTRGMWDATIYRTSTSSEPASSTSASSCTVPQWAQCDGIYYAGCKTCAAPYACNYFNDWYSQCL